MTVKKLCWSTALAVMLSITPAFADGITGTAGAGFHVWAGTNLNENGSPYWDNPSMDGANRNVGFYLVNAPTAPLPGAPGPLPFWGTSFTSNTDSGGSADLNFFFVKTAPTSTVDLKLEVAGKSNVNEFGWYDTAATNILHPLFLGADIAVTSSNFSPSESYGFYIRSDNTDLFFTQSSLNSGGDTGHQHFAVFRESPVVGITGAAVADSYWIGVEDLSVNGLAGNEGNAGDYNDMLIHLSVLPIPVPEPSTAMLVLSGSVLVIGIGRRRHSKRETKRLRRRTVFHIPGSLQR